MTQYILSLILAASLMGGCGVYAAHEPSGEPDAGKNSALSPAEQGQETKAPKK